MSGRITLLIALLGLGAAAYGWSQSFDEVPVTTASVVQGSAREEPRSAPAVAPETLDRAKRAAKEPAASAPVERPAVGRGQASGKWSAVTIADADDLPVPRQATSSMSGKRLSSPRPGDDVARAQLVRDIQYELRRVGCYDGELHGWWSSNTKRAMKAFTDRVNATLPVEEADYILLSLVQGHKGLACGRACPAGQLAAADGRCLPRAIVAQRKGGTQKSSASMNENAGVSPAQQTPVGREPLPGRMAVGSPIAGASERAEIALEEARRRGESAALEEQRSKPALETSQTDASKASGGTAGLALPASAATALASQSVDPNAPPADMRRRERAGPYRAPNRSHVRKGSTREVFATVMRSAP